MLKGVLMSHPYVISSRKCDSSFGAETLIATIIGPTFKKAKAVSVILTKAC